MGQTVVRSYRDLEVWQKGMDLVSASYRLAVILPDHERYGLISRMRSAAVSITANIAEGHGRDYRREYLRHLSLASALAELQTCFEMTHRLAYVAEAKVDAKFAMADEGRQNVDGPQEESRPSRSQEGRRQNPGTSNND